MQSFSAFSLAFLCFSLFFILWSFNYFDLLSYSSEMRKRYALRLLWVCMEALIKGSTWVKWGMQRNCGFQKKLYQSIGIWRFRSKLNHGSTKTGRLHCVVLKVLNTFKNKEQTTRQEMRYLRAWECLIRIWDSPGQSPELTQKLATKTVFATIFGHYYAVFNAL